MSAQFKTGDRLEVFFMGQWRPATFHRYRTEDERREWRSEDDCCIEIDWDWALFRVFPSQELRALTGPDHRPPPTAHRPAPSTQQRIAARLFKPYKPNRVGS